MVREREVWRATVHGVPRSQTWLGNWTITTKIVDLQYYVSIRYTVTWFRCVCVCVCVCVYIICIFRLFSIIVYSVHFSSVTQSCPSICDSIDCSMPGFPVHHQLPELAQTHVHGDAIQPSHPLPSPSLPTFNLSQHQGLCLWVSSSHQVAKVLESPFQNQSFQRIFRTDFL